RPEPERVGRTAMEQRPARTIEAADRSHTQRNHECLLISAKEQSTDNQNSNSDPGGQKPSRNLSLGQRRRLFDDLRRRKDAVVLFTGLDVLAEVLVPVLEFGHPILLLAYG